MKKSLGNIAILLLVIFVGLVGAEDFEYKIDVDNKQGYLKEVVILTANFYQINPNIVLMFDFDLVKSKDYDFKRVEASENDLDHNTKASYRYLVYPLKSGRVEIDFKLTKRVTTDENVAYSFSGDRDNVKGLVTTDTEVKIPSVMLNIKSIPEGVVLVGDFKLDYELKKKIYKSYEPIPMLLHVEGAGYPPEFKRFPFESDEVKVFVDKPTSNIDTTKITIQSKTTYPIAFSSAKSFKLPTVELKAFNPKTKESYTLRVPQLDFNVQEVKSSELLDNVDMPKSYSSEISEIKSSLLVVLSYIAIFLAGGISGYFLKQKKKEEDRKPQDLKQKIANAKDKKELLQVLLSSKNSSFDEVIKRLECSIYANEQLSLSATKSQLLIKCS